MSTPGSGTPIFPPIHPQPKPKGSIMRPSSLVLTSASRSTALDHDKKHDEATSGVPSVPIMPPIVAKHAASALFDDVSTSAQTLVISTKSSVIVTTPRQLAGEAVEGAVKLPVSPRATILAVTPSAATLGAGELADQESVDGTVGDVSADGGPSTLTSNTSVIRERCYDVAIDSVPTPRAGADVDIESSRYIKEARLFRETLDALEISTFVVDTNNLRIIYVNPYACLVFNRTKFALVGAPLGILVPSDFSAAHDRMVKRFIERWRENKSEPTDSRIFGRVARAITASRRDEDDNEVLFSATIKVCAPESSKDIDGVPKLLIGQVVDTGHIVQMRRALFSASLIVEKSVVGIVEADLEGRILRINPEIERIFGYSQEFLKGQTATIHKFAPESFRPEHVKIISVFARSLKEGKYDPTGSTVICKTRLTNGEDADHNLIPISLQVALVEDPEKGGKYTLVAQIMDARRYTPVQELKMHVAKSVLPPKLAKKYIEAGGDLSRVSQVCKNSIVIIVDIVKSTDILRGMADDQVERYLRKLFVAAAQKASMLGINVVKYTGDGVLAVASDIHEDDEPARRANRAIYFAMSLTHWANENRYNIRVGMDIGAIRSVVLEFDATQVRLGWDIIGPVISAAERMQQTAFDGDPGPTPGMSSAIKITNEVHRKLTRSSELSACFTEVSQSITGVKGFSDLSEDCKPGADISKKGLFMAYRNNSLKSVDVLTQQVEAFRVGIERRKAAAAELAASRAKLLGSKASDSIIAARPG